MFPLEHSACKVEHVCSFGYIAFLMSPLSQQKSDCNCQLQIH